MDEAVCRVLPGYETRMEAENREMQSVEFANAMARRDAMACCAPAYLWLARGRLMRAARVSANLPV